MKTDFAITAIRLKELRTIKKLSHEKLREQLLAMGADISVSSLKDYEISETSRANHAKAGKVKGMRIENLFALSEFYGVSADYLLGRTDIPSANPSVQNACVYTGLSEKAINNIRNIASTKEWRDNFDKLLSSFDFFWLINEIQILLANKNYASAYLDEKRYSSLDIPPEEEEVDLERTEALFCASKYRVEHQLNKLLNSCFGIDEVMDKMPEAWNALSAYALRHECLKDECMQKFEEDQPDDDLKEELRSAMWGDAASSNTDTEPQ